MARVPGLYNEEARVEIEVLGEREQFDFFNLTAVERANCMNQHFEVLQKSLKEQLKIDQFDEFGLPLHDEVQRICGRIINMSTEDDKLKNDSIGIFNIGDSQGSKTYKLKLNMSEMTQFNLLEGEVIVAEGSNDSNSRFNVSRIYKPQISPPYPTD